MKIGVYLCECGTNIKSKIDASLVQSLLRQADGDLYFQTVAFACSEDGKSFMEQDIKKNKPDRVVVAACSPRDHEETFRKVLVGAGMNPYLLQMVNVREQIAWVTEDAALAADKAARQIRAAMARVRLQEPLEKQYLDICPAVLIIGAGPAGLKAALSLAQAGRKVVLVEKGPILGGMPVRYEEVFPRMECGPCMLEPILGDVLHGPHAANIEIMLLSELEAIAGSYGNFIVKIKKRPRYVDPRLCIGCGDCITACPVKLKNPFNCGLSDKKAMDFAFFGGLPNAPFIEPSACKRFKGEDCTLCAKACFVEGAVVYDDKESIQERNVGAIVVAIGAELYDCSRLPNLGYGVIPDVYTSLDVERFLAANGPTGGSLTTASGNPPKRVAIVHCVGSLDKKHKQYCSSVCCMCAFKLNHLIAKKVPGAQITHFYKTIVVPGKEEFELCEHVSHNPNTRLVSYRNIDDIRVVANSDGTKNIKAGTDTTAVDLVILCPAMIPSGDSSKIGSLLELTNDKSGFFEELHGRTDASASKVKGIFIAGACQSPMDIQRAMSQGMASTGYILSSLVEGRQLEIEPVTAVVDSERCSGCRTCQSICPYKAISFDEEKESAKVNSVLCVGCGTCVAACPSGVIKGNHFTNDQIVAEIEGVLA